MLNVIKYNGAKLIRGRRHSRPAICGTRPYKKSKRGQLWVRAGVGAEVAKRPQVMATINAAILSIVGDFNVTESALSGGVC